MNDKDKNYLGLEEFGVEKLLSSLEKKRHNHLIFTNELSEEDLYDDITERNILGFVEDCKVNGIMFKNAWLMLRDINRERFVDKYDDEYDEDDIEKYVNYYNYKAYYNDNYDEDDEDEEKTNKKNYVYIINKVIYIELLGYSEILKGTFNLNRRVKLYDYSSIKSGKFDSPVDLFALSHIDNGLFNYDVNLHHTSHIDNGIFDWEVSLQNNSYINNGKFSFEVELEDNSYINNGVFNCDVSMYHNSFINGGIFKHHVNLYHNASILGGFFNDNIYLYDNSEIIDAEFGWKCKIYLYEWAENQATLDLLKRKNVKYEIIEDGSNPARSLA